MKTMPLTSLNKSQIPVPRYITCIHKPGVAFLYKYVNNNCLNKNGLLHPQYCV